MGWAVSGCRVDRLSRVAEILRRICLCFEQRNVTNMVIPNEPIQTHLELILRHSRSMTHFFLTIPW